jgi:hypothetical protein
MRVRFYNSIITVSLDEVIKAKEEFLKSIESSSEAFNNYLELKKNIILIYHELNNLENFKNGGYGNYQSTSDVSGYSEDIDKNNKQLNNCIEQCKEIERLVLRRIQDNYFLCEDGDTLLELEKKIDRLNELDASIKNRLSKFDVKIDITPEFSVNEKLFSEVELHLAPRLLTTAKITDLINSRVSIEKAISLTEEQIKSEEFSISEKKCIANFYYKIKRIHQNNELSTDDQYKKIEAEIDILTEKGSGKSPLLRFIRFIKALFKKSENIFDEEKVKDKFKKMKTEIENTRLENQPMQPNKDNPEPVAPNEVKLL